MHVSKFRLIVAGVLTAVSFSLLGAGTAYAVQTHMFNARDDLQNALNELNKPSQTRADIGSRQSIWLTRPSIR